ncbi:MAG: STAS-like domain-containing protein [Burkholderiales bacterium]|nr:STAS-like domain-containing protein [Burkholderiales bacterium]
MKATTTINVAQDFSKEPAGRYPEDGPNNGQRFRLEKLVSGLSEAQKLVIELDGTEGYGSSFLEEAFGGLVRDHGFTPQTLRERLVLVSKGDDTIPLEIWDYVDTALVKKKP